MVSCNLNRDAEGVYLARLAAGRYIRLVTSSEGRKTFAITAKGRRWLKKYQDLLDEEKSTIEE